MAANFLRKHMRQAICGAILNKTKLSVSSSFRISSIVSIYSMRMPYIVYSKLTTYELQWL